MNILYAVSESAPFVKTGGLADVAGSLPKTLCSEGTDTRVILPLYSAISEKWRSQMNFLFYTYVHLAWRKQYCGLFSLEHEGVIYYFIDNEYYFKRESVYGCYDDGERFGFFSKAVAEILPLIGWKPDIINCNDWQTALIPIYLRQEPAEFYGSIKTVFTIHNIEYQGRFGKETLDDVFGLPNELYDSGEIRYDDDLNLMKGAILKADHITTVSPSYAFELRDPYFACGLHKVIEYNSFKLTGIVNGLDTGRFNPMTDGTIIEQYGPHSPDGKKECRKDLCREIGLDEDEYSPIIACVSRLVGHKGFDLVSDALDRIVSKGARLVILGTGDGIYENFFRDAEARYKGRVSANIMYSEKRASKLYAGADIMLMPSRSEPCGLTQMIAMRYGTVPIVRAVGGLRDTVRPYPAENSNGFTFYDYSADAMLGAIDYAIDIWQSKDEWWNLMCRGMTEDLSWNHSAKEYINIYKALMI
ncbi:MAG: glycogen synthase GlgA [Clostridiales bacterium]|jgi:starch synthase|nr:glycogen synthase GlgA [Clostridiales bacterium]